jgi:CPA1 family monovalent cation:H+ antiporter
MNTTDRTEADVTGADETGAVEEPEICEHLRASAGPPPPVRTDGCETCLEIGQVWVHLRQCLGCGRVGCCDDSIGKHASRHAREVGHPVIRSLEPGEAWRWCFVDSVGVFD